MAGDIRRCGPCGCSPLHIAIGIHLDVKTLGLKWKRVSSRNRQKLTKNNEIKDKKSFASELQSSTTFLEEELDNFGIKGIRADNFIRSGDSIFQPAAKNKTSAVE